MCTLQERTCARDCALCLRHIHTSAHQRVQGMLEKNATARSQGLAAASRPMGSAALRRACFARAAPHSVSLSLLLFLKMA